MRIGNFHTLPILRRTYNTHPTINHHHSIIRCEHRTSLLRHHPLLLQTHTEARGQRHANIIELEANRTNKKKKNCPNGKILGRLHLIGRERVSRLPNNRAAHFRCCLSGAVIKQKLRHCGYGTCDDIHIHNRRTVIFQSISKKTLRKKVHLFILYVSSVYMRTTLVFGEMERN